MWNRTSWTTTSPKKKKLRLFDNKASLIAGWASPFSEDSKKPSYPRREKSNLYNKNRSLPRAFVASKRTYVVILLEHCTWNGLAHSGTPIPLLVVREAPELEKEVHALLLVDAKNAEGLLGKWCFCWVARGWGWVFFGLE